MKLTLKNLKILAQEKNKRIVYNRSLGGYQVISGFTSSEVVYAARDENNKLYLFEKDLRILKSYI